MRWFEWAHYGVTGLAVLCWAIFGVVALVVHLEDRRNGTTKSRIQRLEEEVRALERERKANKVELKLLLEQLQRRRQRGEELVSP